jgi:tetratricopeptide (TPR) repeat protein
MPDTQSAQALATALQRGTELLKAGRTDDAAALARTLVDANPRAFEARLYASHAEQQRVRFDAMLEHARHAVALEPGHIGAQYRLMECLIYCGRFDEVLERLARLEATAGDDPRLLCRLAEFYSQGNRHAEARRCYRRAVGLQPGDPGYLFSLAASEIALGELESAEALLDRVIALDPHDYDAYRNRATLRGQSSSRNHIDELERVLAAGPRRSAGEVQLCYALAKEYEDLGEYRKAFAYLKRGADRRRALLSYRVEHDLAVMARIRQVFGAELFRRAPPGHDQAGPVFVLGLPRSGTTLVDRILSSHSCVHSLGEINDFAYALMHVIGAGSGKLELVERAAQVDFHALGRRYCQGTQAYGFEAPLLIDKTPLNYLYIGLIHLALPNARIVHLRRHPMDSCYGMYRTLFRAGYPFSYDLDDLARYYTGYRDLMDHWRAVIPGAFLDLSYEGLVERQADVTRELLAYCGLDWETACLNFHENASPVSTASSAQVRRPVYRDALQRWRRYEHELAPLADRLAEAGVDIDAP